MTTRLERLPGGRVGYDPETKAVVITRSGRKVAEVGRQPLRTETPKKAPKGTISSLLPKFEGVFCESLPQKLSPDPNFWYEIQVNARYAPEESIKLLRKAGFSAEEVAGLMMEKMKSLSPQDGWNCEDLCEDLKTNLTEELKKIYVSTVYVSPRLRRKKK